MKLNSVSSGKRTSAQALSIEGALSILSEHFESEGATRLSLPFMYPSETLLDLYGEDLRTRAFVYGDAERDGEVCLRPDFTVPVALAHGERGWDEKAAYTYQGTVFRRQPNNADRPVEYLQAGMERFGDSDVAASDAAVFLSLMNGLGKLGVPDVSATLGDLSIVLAVLDALEMPSFRREALKRHLWRPRRFQDLIARACRSDERTASAPVEVSPIEGDIGGRSMSDAGEIVGMRSERDVEDRLAELARQANAAAMPYADAKLISNVLSVKGPAQKAAECLRRLTENAEVDIEVSLLRFEKRLELITDETRNALDLHFDATFGRTLEYYDGFVFELRTASGVAHPPLAGGGRYDAMTRRLGASRQVPAIGGIVRPEAVLEALK